MIHKIAAHYDIYFDIGLYETGIIIHSSWFLIIGGSRQMHHDHDLKTILRKINE